jgi:MFS family permease
LSEASTPFEKHAGGVSRRAMLLPLAAAQFLASYDTQSMNVAIGNIVEDLDTTVIGVQTAISLFTLTMAALMIPGSILTDILGRRRCFVMGVSVYAVGAAIAALSPSLAFLILGWSFFEGTGSALMIPPIYIIVTVMIDDLTERANRGGARSSGRTAHRWPDHHDDHLARLIRRGGRCPNRDSLPQSQHTGPGAGGHAAQI